MKRGQVLGDSRPRHQAAWDEVPVIDERPAMQFVLSFSRSGAHLTSDRVVVDSEWKTLTGRGWGRGWAVANPDGITIFEFGPVSR
jgi:hypothetical protein